MNEKRNIANEKIKRILVIRFRRVGDAVISSVLCSSLKKTFPDASIDYVLNKPIAPLFEHHPAIDHLITFEDQDMASLPTYTKKVRNIMRTGNYDMIVDSRSTIKTLWFSLFSLHTPYRLGKKKWYNWFLHNYRTDVEGVVDEVTKTLRLLQPLEKKFKVTYDRDFKLFYTPSEKQDFAQYMHHQGIDFDKPVIVCAVATRVPHKAWDMLRMKEILFRILDHADVQLVFNYAGEAEMKQARQLHEEMNNHPAVFTNIEAKNLRELIALIANSSFFFGNEGGPRHIAQALDIPTFAIYPPQIDKAEWLPNASERFQGVEPQDIVPDINQQQISYQEKFAVVSVEEVWARLSTMLEKVK